MANRLGHPNSSFGCFFFALHIVNIVAQSKNQSSAMNEPFNEEDLKKTEVHLIEISKLRLEDDNPREIRTSKFSKLKKSLLEFPEMLLKRPIVYDKDMIVRGGNMRVRAGIAIGWEKIPAVSAEDWSKDQIREFIVKDNIEFGDWDYDTLSSFYDLEELDKWGFDKADIKDHYVTTDYDEILDAGDDPEYPIMAKASEKYDYVMILAENEIDMAYLETMFDLKHETSYKNTDVGVGRVISIDRFRDAIGDKLNANYQRKEK